MAQIEDKVKELSNVKRIVENMLNFIADSEVKGSDVFALAEIVNWLQQFQKSLQVQLDAYAEALPSQGTDAPSKVVEGQVVSPTQGN